MKAKLSIIITLIVLLTSCEKDGITDRAEVATGARLCFYNLSPDASEINLYLNDTRVTAQLSNTKNVLRGIPYRSTFPGIVTASVVATTIPTSYIGSEYFLNAPGQYTVTVKDTAYRSGYTTFFTSSNTFEEGKYYSVFAMDSKNTMTCIITEDDLKPFTALNKIKVRIVDALLGVPGGVDMWLIHQPATTESAIPPYKLSSSIEYKTVSSFIDTISAGNYKWMVTKAGAVPTTIIAPTSVAKPYTITFNASDIVIAQATTATTLSQKRTISFLLYGIFGSSGVKAPYGSFFVNRVN